MNLDLDAIETAHAPWADAYGLTYCRACGTSAALEARDERRTGEAAPAAASPATGGAR